MMEGDTTQTASEAHLSGQRTGWQGKQMVAMKNEVTGDLREVKVGWSWTLFFFAGFFGLPLFMRKLPLWGGVMAFLAVIQNFGVVVVAIQGQIILGAMMWGFSIYLGAKGNEITAKNYLQLGWVFVEPESELVSHAKKKWQMHN